MTCRQVPVYNREASCCQADQERAAADARATSVRTSRACAKPVRTCTPSGSRAADRQGRPPSQVPAAGALTAWEVAHSPSPRDGDPTAETVIWLLPGAAFAVSVAGQAVQRDVGRLPSPSAVAAGLRTWPAA